MSNRIESGIIPVRRGSTILHNKIQFRLYEHVDLALAAIAWIGSTEILGSALTRAGTHDAL
jgi:hypothetical protein